MTYPITTDTIRRVQNREGQCLDIRPWPDAPDSVALMSVDARSADYFGRLELAMDPEFARAIGRALIACADDIDRDKAGGGP